MVTYNSITNSNPATTAAFTLLGPAPCGGTFPYPATTDAANVPASIVREYVPKEEYRRVSDPTKAMKRNWSRIKRSGVISMTPYSNNKTVIENYVVSREKTRPYVKWNSRTCSSTTPPGVNLKDFGILVSRWTENDHLGSLSPVLLYSDDYQDALEDFRSQVQNAIHTTQSAAFAESLSSFDVLTQIAEGRETLTYMQSKVKEAADAMRKLAHQDERTWRRARGTTAERLLKSSDKAFRKLGSRWMEYRYAIMPLIYSIKDINELLGKRSEVYKTTRSKELIQVSFERPDLEVGNHVLYRTGAFSAEVRSTVKSAYNGGALQRIFDQSSFNIFKTGWELIPYSFVVDWFLNVGDVITSQTSIDFSSQKVCCTSVKETRLMSTWRFDGTSDSKTFTDPVSVTFPAGRVQVYTFNRNQDDLLQVAGSEDYRRFLWTKPSPRLTFDPFLNWKRFLDSLVLGYQPTKKILRSL